MHSTSASRATSRSLESDLRQFATWNATEQPYPRGILVPQLVARQAALYPDKIAVASWNQIITYSQLNDRADRLACYLFSLGVDANTVVGICLERSINFVVGALAILKSGGAYLPLDPACPSDRLAFLLADASIGVLLTQQHISRQLSPGEWKVIHLEDDQHYLSFESKQPPKPSVGGQDLAYVIYTSGSTGRPKGVEITHDSLLNLVFWHQRTFDVKPADRASQLANSAFDASVWELWPYLTAGASISIVGDTARTEPESLRDWMVGERITIGFVPTPLAERMVSLKWPRETALRVLLTGADTLHTYPRPDLPFTVVNNYGPTECTVVASSGPVPPKERPDGPPSIGRPIANVQVYIVDEQMQQVPVGVVGEICIGGAGLARGYRNDSELSARRFLPNPFNSLQPARLYRTGDMGRYLPDGQIAFIGRLDEQIKIQGYRIEPNEVVGSLVKHSMVEASAVVAREDIPGKRQLVAYVVPKPGTNPSHRLLRDFLCRQLPEYMVPAVFVRVDSLPVNANGKVDPALLPAPDHSNSLDEESYVAPRTPIERRMADIVGPLLGLEKVSVDDNFFMLGGHSLLGTQLIARTRQVFGVELSLRTLFGSPSIAALAETIEHLLCARLEAMSEKEAAQFLTDTNA